MSGAPPLFAGTVKPLVLPAVALALALPAHAGRSPRAVVAARALSQSVRVRIEKAGEVRRVASGVVVAARPGWAQVLTNAHVLAPVDGGSDFAVMVVAGEQARAARTVAVGQVPENDLALVEVTGFDGLVAAELADEGEVAVGDDVIVVGSPFGRGLTIAAGIVSQIELEGADPMRQKAMKTDAPIAYGSSGGGVFSVPGGKLVALVEGYRTARVNLGDRSGFDVPMPGETFLAPLSKVRAFLARHAAVPPSTAPGNTSKEARGVAGREPGPPAGP